jgi:hypothetical protein
MVKEIKVGIMAAGDVGDKTQDTEGTGKTLLRQGLKVNLS